MLIKLYYGKKIEKNSLQSRVLKNHYKFTGKIGKKELDHRQHSWLHNIRNCNIPDVAILFRHVKDDTICIVR